MVHHWIYFLRDIKIVIFLEFLQYHLIHYACLLLLYQIAYQVGCYDIARQACGVLWRHFVAAPPLEQTETYISSEQRDFKLTLFRYQSGLHGAMRCISFVAAVSDE